MKKNIYSTITFLSNVKSFHFKQIMQLASHFGLKVITMTILLASLFSSSVAAGQTSTSAAWALTANGNAAVTGNVSATAIGKGSGITTQSQPHDSNGINATGFNSNAFDSIDYFEFSVTPSSTEKLNITGISGYFSHNSSNTVYINIRYSTDNWTTNTQLTPQFGISSSHNSQSSYSTNINVAANSTIKFRVYAHNVKTGSEVFRIKNFVISGTTTPNCSATSISNNPTAQSKTYGENASFSVTAANATSYQWEVSTNGGASWATIDGTANNSALTHTLNITKPTVAMNGNLYRCKVSNNCPSTATSNSATLNVTAKMASVIVHSNSKIYGSEDPELTGTLEGFLAEDNVTATCSRVSGEKVMNGPYTISANLSPTSVLSNYNITYTNANFTITKKDASVVVTQGQTKVYGSADPDLAGTLESFLAEDNIIATYKRVDGETVMGGPYTISATLSPTSVLSNYNITNTADYFVITPAPVMSEIVVSTPTQYSDKATFTARLVGGTAFFSEGPQAASNITFKVGTQTMGTETFTADGSDLVATGIYNLLEGVSGQMSPGFKTVTVIIDGTDTNYSIDNLSPETSLEITKEDARAEYTGATFASTTSATNGNAIITLAATIRDISATNVAKGDDQKGDIRNAKVRFINRDNNSAISDWLNVGLVNTADLTTGTVVFNWPINIGNSDSSDYTVGIEVGNYYTRNSGTDNTVVTVSKPQNEFITGGGYIIPTQSNGFLASDAGRKTNFGFNVKYNKGGKKLQGRINSIIRVGEKTYQIKGNSMTSLSVNMSNNNARTAIFNGKCNIQDITDPLNVIPVSNTGGSIMQVTLTDKGEPGSNDEYAISVWDNNGGLLYSSNWAVPNTVKMKLSGGNIVIHSSSNLNNVTGTAKFASDEIASVKKISKEDFKVTAYPNPTANAFSLNITGAENNPVTVNVIDITGKVIYTASGTASQNFSFGESFSAGMYILEVRSGNKEFKSKLIKK